MLFWLTSAHEQSVQLATRRYLNLQSARGAAPLDLHAAVRDGCDDVRRGIALTSLLQERDGPTDQVLGCVYCFWRDRIRTVRVPVVLQRTQMIDAV